MHLYSTESKEFLQSFTSHRDSVRCLTNLNGSSLLLILQSSSFLSFSSLCFTLLLFRELFLSPSSPPHLIASDELFTSASLDGAIIVWRSLSLLPHQRLGPLPPPLLTPILSLQFISPSPSFFPCILTFQLSQITMNRPLVLFSIIKLFTRCWFWGRSLSFSFLFFSFSPPLSSQSALLSIYLFSSPSLLIVARDSSLFVLIMDLGCTILLVVIA